MRQFWKKQLLGNWRQWLGIRVICLKIEEEKLEDRVLMGLFFMIRYTLTSPLGPLLSSEQLRVVPFSYSQQRVTIHLNRYLAGRKWWDRLENETNWLRRSPEWNLPQREFHGKWIQRILSLGSVRSLTYSNIFVSVIEITWLTSCNSLRKG